MTSRENVKRAIEFKNPEWLPYQFSPDYGTDIAQYMFGGFQDKDGRKGFDEWGVGWAKSEVARIGQVNYSPLDTWDKLDLYNFPNLSIELRWQNIKKARNKFPDKFLLGNGISLFERVQQLRGMLNLFEDMAVKEKRLDILLEKLTEMNLYAIDMYAQADFDGYFFTDDWGFQDRLMISPEMWHDQWKKYYRRIYAHAHKKGLKTFLHSCGHITGILDSFINSGVDVINMEQQVNMGLETLSQFKGRITFFCPADIQKVLVSSDLSMVRSYCRKMVNLLGTLEGGFIARWYGDPVSAGHNLDAVRVMQEEFLSISQEMYGKTGF